MKEAAATRVLSMVVALVSWVFLAAGAFLAPVSADPMDDLEAGGGFGVFLYVFLPWCGLTVLVVVVTVLGIVLRAMGLAGALIGATTVTFGLYVLTFEEMLAYQPALAGTTWVSVVLGSIAIVFAGLAAAVRTEPAPMSEETTSARAG